MTKPKKGIKEFPALNSQGNSPFFGPLKSCVKKQGAVYGSIHLFLLGISLCALNLPYVALAQSGYTTTDRAMIGRIEADINIGVGTYLRNMANDISGSYSTLNFIQTDTGNLRTDFNQYLTYDIPIIESNLQGISNLVAKIAKAISNGVDLTQVEQDLEDSLTELKLINNNMGYLAEGTALENSDGQGFDNLISGINYGSRSMSMADSLQLIGQAVGGLGTSFGPHTQDNATLPLIRTILGWNSGFASSNIQTNGIIGLLQSINREVVRLHTMTNPIISAIEKQTDSLTNSLSRIEQILLADAFIQTNQLFMLTLASPQETVEWDEFLRFLRMKTPPAQYLKANTGSYLYFLPYWTVPYTSGSRQIDNLYGTDLDWTPIIEGDLEGIAGEFYKYYGNFASYDMAYGDESPYSTEVGEGATNLLQRTQAAKDTNIVVAATLEPLMGIPQMNSDVSQFSSIKSTYQNLHTIPAADISKWSQYFEDTTVESEESAGFQFGIQFTGSSGESIEVATADTDFFEGLDLTRIRSIGNNWIKYGVGIIKGILMLLFVWSVAEKAVNIFINNGMQTG